jgi:predicted DNA-binding ribbon-helix-helix protein
MFDEKGAKHSINMASRKTSISLEPTFWRAANAYRGRCTL